MVGGTLEGAGSHIRNAQQMLRCLVSELEVDPHVPMATFDLLRAVDRRLATADEHAKDVAEHLRGLPREVFIHDTDWLATALLARKLS